MKKIGFAYNQYTLWHIEESEVYQEDAYGVQHLHALRLTYKFVRNLGTNLQSALESVGIESQGFDCADLINYTGHATFTRYKHIDKSEGYFWFGKYYGHKVECVLVKDFEFCLRYQKCRTTKDTPTALYIRECSIFKDYLQVQQSAKDSLLSKFTCLKVGQVATLEFESNGYRYQNHVWANATFGTLKVKVRFTEGKDVGGKYPYVMPILNGSAKKLKGKAFEVRVSSIINTSVKDGNAIQRIEVTG